MPTPEPAELGPLAALAGTWEGEEGVDVAFSHGSDEVHETRYRERAEFNPFGPVRNGKQSLFGLDYRTVAWPLGEEEPFHMEAGYWVWDADAGHVMRCFTIPRGCTVLAGGPAHADSTTWTMQAEVGSETYGILSNRHLATAARTTLYQVTIDVRGADTFAYEETTVVEISGVDAPVDHTDRNVLHRVEN